MNTCQITQADRDTAQCDLKMLDLSDLELGALIEEHRNSPLFASRVIASAARQILVAKRTMAMCVYEREPVIRKSAQHQSKSVQV